jgi:rubredoxin
MNPLPPSHRCRVCGSTSYRKLTHRGSDGIMSYSGEYRCSGCDFTFSEPVEWRERRLRPRRDESAAAAEEETQRSA